MSHCAFMDRRSKPINVSAVDLVCSVDDIRMIKKAKIHTSFGTLFPKCHTLLLVGFLLLLLG